MKIVAIDSEDKKSEQGKWKFEASEMDSAICLRTYDLMVHVLTKSSTETKIEDCYCFDREHSIIKINDQKNLDLFRKCYKAPKFQKIDEPNKRGGKWLFEVSQIDDYCIMAYHQMIGELKAMQGINIQDCCYRDFKNSILKFGNKTMLDLFTKCHTEKTKRLNPFPGHIEEPESIQHADRPPTPDRNTQQDQKQDGDTGSPSPAVSPASPLIEYSKRNSTVATQLTTPQGALSPEPEPIPADIPQIVLT